MFLFYFITYIPVQIFVLIKQIKLTSFFLVLFIISYFDDKIYFSTLSEHASYYIDNIYDAYLYLSANLSLRSIRLSSDSVSSCTSSNNLWVMTSDAASSSHLSCDILSTSQSLMSDVMSTSECLVFCPPF